MRKLLVAISLCVALGATGADVRAPADVLTVDDVAVAIHPLGHASLVLVGASAAVYVDPVGDLADYRNLPTADIILITHDHGDHFSADLVRELAGEHTKILAPLSCVESVPGNNATILAAGDSVQVSGVGIIAVQAYNTTSGREKFHPKGRGNGYVLDFTGLRVYLSGDTEDIPEMKTLKAIDAAFLAMNQPYTMTVDQAARTVRQISPHVVYPYHFRGQGGTVSDLKRFAGLVAEIAEVRVLDWYPEAMAAGGADAAE